MKKDFLPNLVIIVATTLLVVVVFYNIYVFVPSIQNTFGNLADWFMVVITAITAVFIYRTLNSQMEVQRDQNIITRIEKDKYFNSIKPNFSFTAKESGNNIILSIITTAPCSIYDATITINDDIKRLSAISRKQNQAPIRFATLPTLLHPINNSFFVNFNYTDLFENNYSISGSIYINLDLSVNFIVSSDRLTDT